MKVRYTIEPSWTIDQHSEELEIEDEALEGLSGEARAEAITEIVSDAVNNDCPWGWEETGQ